MSEAKVPVDWARLSFILGRERQDQCEPFLIERSYEHPRLSSDARSSAKAGAAEPADE